MGIMTNQNACRGKLLLFLVALVVLAGVRPGIAEVSDQEAERQLKAMMEAASQDDLEKIWTKARQGDAGAQFILGLMYFKGKGVPEDHREAAKWFRKAAEQGDAGAQFNLGVMYFKGEGVPEDHREAVKWLRKAAEQGYARAQFNLGVRGEGVLKDYREAVKWYRMAADQGHAGSQFRLGVMYFFGGGVPKDYVKAYAWMNLAAAQGDENAPKGKDVLREKMTPEQVAEAQELSSELFNRIESSKSK